MATSASSLPVGFRFHPTEEELVDHYLKNKIKGRNFNDVIPEIDICSCEPWDLPGFSLIGSDDDEWFYFSRPDYKTKGNSRNRATEKGFWKITGVEREIRARRSKALIGKKRTLTFYIGKVRSGQKTVWVIHEYYIPETLLPNAARQRDFVLCRLKKKDEGTDNGACTGGEVCEPSTNNAFDFQNLIMTDFGRPSIPEENTRPEDIFATLFSAQESPQSPDYFTSNLRDIFLHANAGSDDDLELQSAFGHDDLEDGDYSLEDRSRTTLFNHSSEPKSLHKVYEESIHQQGQSIRDTNAVLLKSSQNESGGRKLQMVTTGGGQEQSETKLPNRSYDYSTHSKVKNEVAESSRGHVKQGFKPQEVGYTSKAREKPKEPEKPKLPEKPQPKPAGITLGDWKSSFIVWKESPLSLRSYPPVVYAWNMIFSLLLFIFFVEELISYGKW
ncbi:NAC domain-containing protein 14-like [Argentina anserina]|uniref:NAC domain-containing protein 14-like n=1 Tax=Argentina anserina TaxID=57926 RepID=UPI0021763CE2|nr:NAC domain-containing protein 14-like [Potentilla anserina]